jgi:hypothetical protein
VDSVAGALLEIRTAFPDLADITHVEDDTYLVVVLDDRGQADNQQGMPGMMWNAGLSLIDVADSTTMGIIEATDSARGPFYDRPRSAAAAWWPGRWA